MQSYHTIGAYRLTHRWVFWENGWLYPRLYSDGLQAHINGENIDGQDVMTWYCGHLSHEAAHGGDEWHHTGPYLVPFQNWNWA